MTEPTLCTIQECNRQARSTSSEYCSIHYGRIYKTGTPYRHCKKCKTKLPENHGRKVLCNQCAKPQQCSIEGCEKPAKGRGWCAAHWLRWRKYGDPLGKSDYKQIKRDCEVEGCKRPYHANGYCGYHGYRVEKYGNPLAQGPGRGVGRKRMEVPSYDGVHKRLQRDIGKASQFNCADCGKQANEWSYDGGCPNEHWGLVENTFIMAYSTDQSRYSPRCTSCHRKHDRNTHHKLTPPDHVIDELTPHPEIIWEEI